MAPVLGEILRNAPPDPGAIPAELPGETLPHPARLPGLLLGKIHEHLTENSVPPLLGSSNSVEQHSSNIFSAFLSEHDGKSTIHGALQQKTGFANMQASTTLIPPECVTADSLDPLLRKICDVLTPDDKTNGKSCYIKL